MSEVAGRKPTSDNTGCLFWFVGIATAIPVGLALAIWLDGFLWPYRVLPERLGVERVLASDVSIPFGPSCAWYLLKRETAVMLRTNDVTMLHNARNEVRSEMSPWRPTPMTDADWSQVGKYGDTAIAGAYKCGSEFRNLVDRALSERGYFYAIAPPRGNSSAIYIVMPREGYAAYLGYD